MALSFQAHDEVIGADYEADVIAWAKQQVRLLRAGQFSRLDVEHIIEEIEDVAKSERREFQSRMAVLLAHLLKWQYQPEYRGNSWRRMISGQRERIVLSLKKTPSLKPDLQDAIGWQGVWDDALAIAVGETGLFYDAFPEACPWPVANI